MNQENSQLLDRFGLSVVLPESQQRLDTFLAVPAFAAFDEDPQALTALHRSAAGPVGCNGAVGASQAACWVQSGVDAIFRGGCNTPPHSHCRWCGWCRFVMQQAASHLLPRKAAVAM
jgi:hypothetical protein